MDKNGSNKTIMSEEEVRGICAASMLTFDEAVHRSLAVIEEMMEEVVHSDLVSAGELRPLSRAHGTLREDIVSKEFTREEMLAGVRERNGAYAVVPRVIG